MESDVPDTGKNVEEDNDILASEPSSQATFRSDEEESDKKKAQRWMLILYPVLTFVWITFIFVIRPPSSVNDCACEVGIDAQVDPTTSQVVFPIGTGHIRHGRLRKVEREMAHIAWKYFENNYNPETGLVNAVNNYPSTTLWDSASYIAALVSAESLGVILRDTFDRRMLHLITALKKMAPVNGELPNKVYHSKSLKKVNYLNKPGEIGFSAIDIGRMLTWLHIVKGRYPIYADNIDKVVLGWSFCNLIQDGTMYGSYIDKNTKKINYVQEGRLGYEEYAAKGFQLWGFNVDKALALEPYATQNLYGYTIPVDSRDNRTLKANNYVVSESYTLDGIEFNWDNALDFVTDDQTHSDKWSAEVSRRIYKVQEQRFKKTGILTARTEHQLASKPYFVYDTIFANGYAWNTITEFNKSFPSKSALVTKGAIGLWAMWDTPYTDLLFDAIRNLNNPKKGFFEGRFENGTGAIKTYTANNNGILLSSLAHKQLGKLVQAIEPGHWDYNMKHPANPKNPKCHPVSGSSYAQR